MKLQLPLTDRVSVNTVRSRKPPSMIVLPGSTEKPQKRETMG